MPLLSTSLSLLVQDHALDGCLVGLVGVGGTAQVALELGGLAVAVEQVTLLGHTTLNFATLGEGEALLSAAVSLDLRHNRKLLFLFFAFFSGLGGQEDGHVSTFQLGLLVQDGGLFALFGKLDQQTLTDIVANGGMLRTLNVCDSIRDGQGLVLQPLRRSDGKRVLSGHTAKRLREMMTKAVAEGTGKSAANEYTSAAGKTGTAETGWSENGVLQVHGWFCGFFPAEEPQYCITVFLENGQSGGKYAAPLFSKASEILLKNFKKF